MNWIKRIFSKKVKEKHSVSNCLSFTEQIKQYLIPRVWEMTEEEKEHLGWLIDNDAPTEMINKSSRSLSHLRQRHKEYNDYVANIDYVVANERVYAMVLFTI